MKKSHVLIVLLLIRFVSNAQNDKTSEVIIGTDTFKLYPFLFPKEIPIDYMGMDFLFFPDSLSDGSWVQLYIGEDSLVAKKGTYLNHVKQGSFLDYDLSGNLVKHAVYEGGKLIQLISHDFRNNTSLEQVAFDYLALEILPIDYPNAKHIIFESAVEDKISKFTYGICFDDYANLEELSKIEKEKLSKIKKEYSKLRLPLLAVPQKSNDKLFTTRKAKSWKKSAIVISINRANIIHPNFSFVEIISSDISGNNYYYFEIDMKGRTVQRWCKKRAVF